MSSSTDTFKFRSMLITDFFKTHKGKRVIAAHRAPGSTPFVGGSEFSNSITDFSDIKPLFPGGWLSLTYNGSIGQTRLQPAPFFASDDVIALEPLHEEMTDEIKLVFATLIQHQCVGKFSYANKLNLKRLHKQRIMVPVVTGFNGQSRPDWEGLAVFGRALREKTLISRENALTTGIHEDIELSELNFSPMLLTDIFEKVRASTAWFDRINLSMHGERLYPFVSRSAASNGVVEFVPVQDKQPECGNVITVGLDTQTLGYQPVNFYTSQNIQILQHKNLNQFNALVLMTAIKQQLGKFSWGGNGATLKRLKATHIMVPVATAHSGETAPDWDGMTAYGRAMRVRVENAVRAESPSFQESSSNA